MKTAYLGDKKDVGERRKTVTLAYASICITNDPISLVQKTAVPRDQVWFNNTGGGGSIKSLFNLKKYYKSK